jgi:hypothetical protein
MGFHRYFFDIGWKEPSNYHLTLNTGNLSPASCAGIIKGLRDHAIPADVEAQHIQRLKELALGQSIVHRIVYEKGIPIHFLEASVSGTLVELFGVTNSQALVEAATNAAKEAAPDKTVRVEIQVVQDYSVIP